MREKSFEDSAFLGIGENIKQIKEVVADAAYYSGRTQDDISIMAVTKTVDAARINYALSCGIKLIGENRVQEFVEKRENLNLSSCDVHLIGHLQSNKVKQIIGKVSMIQSVDSIKIAKEIGAKSLEIGQTTDILMEINIQSETNKFGFLPVSAVESAYELAQINGVHLCGIMSIPPMNKDEKANRQNFSNINRLFIDICDKKIDNVSMKILSMGMSGDYRAAILEGANLIRVGSAVFGTRKL